MALQGNEDAGRGRALGLHAVAALLLFAATQGAAVGRDTPTTTAGDELRLPHEIPTHQDGRMPVLELFESYLGLMKHGWQLDVIAYSKPSGTTEELPIIALRSPSPGPAIWILSGIHGEEPAGPNAVAEAIDDLAALGERIPVVLMPLCNPHGYARNWRYLNMPAYSETEDGQSVGDSSHMLPDPDDPSRPRAAHASSPEADALTRYLVRLAETYPPRTSIDLHEDDLIAEGYVYSQGELGAEDPLALQAVAVLRENGIPIKVQGQTRFGEEIVGGIIGPVTDSSIDELIGAREILVDGRGHPGPAARTVLTFETPAKDATLARRTAAHLALLRRLAVLAASQQPERP
jgi:hypothetical protein